LAKYFLRRATRELNVKVKDFNKAALNAILHFRWPGNIRQLENRIKKAVVLADSAYITPDDLDLKPEQLDPILPLTQAQEERRKGGWRHCSCPSAWTRSTPARTFLRASRWTASPPSSSRRCSRSTSPPRPTPRRGAIAPSS